MPSSYSIAAFACGAVLLVGAYHAAFVAPRFRAMAAALARTAGSASVTVAPSTNGEAIAGSGYETAERLASLEAAVARGFLHVGFLRYNAFVDVGSDQSFSFALLGSGGDGIVLSSIFAREETRTYGKSVQAFVPQQDASQEEHAAIALARRDGAFVRT